jgi:hypothetical protein
MRGAGQTVDRRDLLPKKRSAKFRRLKSLQADATIGPISTPKIMAVEGVAQERSPTITEQITARRANRIYRNGMALQCGGLRHKEAGAGHGAPPGI